MLKSERISVLFNSEEMKIIEELKLYYSTNTSNLLKESIKHLNKTRPEIKNLAAESKSNKIEEIANKVLGVNKYPKGNRTNLYAGMINSYGESMLLFVVRAMSIGESEIIKISSKRWSLFETHANEIGRGIVLIAYKRCVEDKYRLIAKEIKELKEPLFKKKIDGTHFFYINKVTVEDEVKSEQLIGSKYNEILNILNDAN